MEYPCKYWVHRVEILQGWSTTRTTQYECGYNATIAKYSLADLYLPKMENALFVPPECNGLSCACAVWCPYLLTPAEWTTLLERGKLWVYLWNEEGLEPIVLPWKCHSGHIMELCDNCNNCTKFQFYAELDAWGAFTRARGGRVAE